MTVARAPFGTLPGGAAVEVFTLVNGRGAEIRAMTYGATIISVRVPDRAGRVDDVVLGFDNLDDYLTKARYFGTIVGRYGNRLATAGSHSTDRPFNSRPTTVRTTCTAARRGSTRSCGKPNRSSAAAAPVSPSRTPARTGKRDTPVR
jgi:hypothetical protein